MANTTWNPNDKNSVTLSGGNLTAAGNASGDHGVRGTDIKYAGKFYFEVTIGATFAGADSGFGVAGPGAILNAVTDTRPINAIGSLSALGATYDKNGGVFVNNATQVGTITGLVAASVYACAINLDVSPAKIAFRKVTGGGNWNANVANDPATGAFDISAISQLGVFPVFSSGGNGDGLTANFGDSAFTGTVPAGYTSGWPVNSSAVLYIDPVSLTGSRADHAGGTAVQAITMTTQGAGDVIVVVGTENGSTANTVSTVSGSTLGSFTLRKRHHTKPGTIDMVVEEWYKHNSSALSGETITVTLGGVNDRMGVFGFQVVNADSGIFDVNAAVPATGQNSGSTSRSVTGISTTAAKTLVFAIGYSPASPDTFASGFASGYTGIGGIYGHTGGANFGDITLWGKYVTATQSSVTAATGTISSEQWAAVADAIKENVPGQTGTWGSTETADTFAASAAPSGTWGSTETKDTFSGAGAPNVNATMAVTEAKDTLAASAHLIQKDGSATNFSSSSVSTGTLTLTTTQANDIIVVTATVKGQTISSITDVAGLTWNLRTRGSFDSGNSHMEVWWAYAPAALTADVITLHFSGSTKYEANAFGVCGADTSVPFDTHNANSVTADNGGTGNPTVSITTDYTHDQLIFGVYGSDLVSEDGPAGALVTAISGANAGTGNNNNAVAYVLKSTSQTGLSLSFTQHLGASANRWLMADAIRAKLDVTGTWQSTDLRDTFAGAGYTQAIGSWASTEAKDVFAGTIFYPPRGTWASTEAKDVFAGTGSAAAPLSVDAHAEGGSHDSSAASVSITTTHSDEVIVLGIMAGGHFTHSHVSTITDTAGLTWKKRHQRYQLGLQPSMEIWWAKKSTAGATTITVNTAAETGFLCVQAIAIAGARTTNPFDTHTGAGYYVDNLGSGNPAGSVYSNTSHGIALAFYGSRDVASTGTVSSGFTWVDRITEAETSGLTGRLEWAYSIADGTKFSKTPISFGQVGGDNNDRTIMTDVIVAASEDVLTPSTNDVIRFFFDGPGQQTIVQLSGTNKSQSLALSTYNPDTICVVAVMVQSSLGARVASVTDDGGHSPGWVQRAIEVGVPGSLSLETWWCHFPTAFTGNITVTLDDNTQPGDIVGFVAVGINGADLFQRGEIWDGDSSLPKVNKDAGVASYQTTGNFSSVNADVLEINFASNTGSIFSDGGLENFNEDPWLQFQGNFFGSLTGLLNSNAPNFNIAIQFKFSASPVSNDHTELNVTPSPEKWLMITDVMPVGPAIPPTGVWGSTEAKDTLNHTGDFTAIGIASPGGWVGFVPNRGTLAATDAKDRATNTGAFTAIWDTNGWIGFVPLHFSFGLTEGHDVWASHGWVLGPTTILARWESTEAKDRFGAANIFTWYTTPDSTGDRTSRITVSTNASLGGSSGTPDKLVNGLKGNNAASAIWVNMSQPAPMYFRFDFATPKVVNEATWFQTGTSPQPGLWTWQGSNDASTWVTLSAAPFVLNSGNTGAVIGDFSSNMTAYRFYQVIQTTNAGGNDAPWLWEINFKVAGFSGAMGVSEFTDRMNYQMQLIPKAAPIPARKRRLLIVS